MQHSFDAGQKVGEWKLVEYRPSRYEKRDGTYKCVQPSAWKCVCSCGTVRWVQAGNLRNKMTHSCGHDRKTGKPWRSKDLAPVNSVFALGKL